MNKHCEWILLVVFLETNSLVMIHSEHYKHALDILEQLANVEASKTRAMYEASITATALGKLEGSKMRHSASQLYLDQTMKILSEDPIAARETLDSMIHPYYR